VPHNGLELSCPAEAGGSPLLYGTPPGRASGTKGATRRVSFSELLAGADYRCRMDSRVRTSCSSRWPKSSVATSSS
jgi:hypothetical protein